MRPSFLVLRWLVVRAGSGSPAPRTACYTETMIRPMAKLQNRKLGRTMTSDALR
jgi:hypothetical protein